MSIKYISGFYCFAIFYFYNTNSGKCNLLITFDMRCFRINQSRFHIILGDNINDSDRNIFKLIVKFFKKGLVGF